MKNMMSAVLAVVLVGTSLTPAVALAPLAGNALSAASTQDPVQTVQVQQERRDVRRARREVRRERRDVRQADTARERRSERRDVRDARRDLRRERRDVREARQERRYYNRNGRRYYRNSNDAEIFAGVIGAIVGGAVASGLSASEIASCERRFRSYDRRSGTYLGYDGDRHRCP